MNDSIILQLKDLQVSYGGINAVKNLTLDVPAGKIVTLIGANGAGKSTILKSIAGLVKPRAGEIIYRMPAPADKKTGAVSNELQEVSLSGLSPDKIVKNGVVLVPEGRRVFPNLTVKENLRLGAYLRRDDLTEDFAHVYDLFPRLKEREWQLAGTLSGGEQQMLAVGRALMSRPRLIMMDEPSLGLAPLVVQGIFKIIRDINASGITVLLNEQNANMALQVADLAYVLETGTITKTGTGAELLADESVREAYLGKRKKNNT